MSNKHNNENGIETELSRDLGLTSALAIGIGTMIAAGIFTLSGLAIRNVGSGAIVAFLLAAIVALFTALTYCEFVSIYPKTGEGYLYARKTFPAPLAYFVGWALFLGYVSSCAFYITSLSSYFNEFIWHSPIESLFGLVMLVGLTVLNIKGTKESGRFQIIVTAAKVLLLVWFIYGGLEYVDMDAVVDKFEGDVMKLGVTAAMVFITFFGFSAIAASAGEVKDPVKNIPRAIFISMAVVSVLYILVVLVVLFADITEYTESSMGVAAKKFLGGFGGWVIIGGALFSMISASNASIMAGSRVVLSMSQLGHLPKEIGVINAKTRTPIVATILVGGGIFIAALLLPLEDLSFFANVVLLIALVLVNAALIVHRRKFPDMVRPFKVPLVPLLPILGILANLYLLAQAYSQPVPFWLAIGCLAAGMLGFVLWKSNEPEETAIPGIASHVAHSVGRGSMDKSKFRILVPIANPVTVKNLVDLAVAVAKDNDGEILFVRVVTVPEQVPPTSFDEDIVEKERVILDKARKEAEKRGILSHTVVRVGHDIGRAILETAREHSCKLIILGWKGHTTSSEKILGNITDDVIKYARTDIMLVKMTGTVDFKRLLLPTAGGEHALYAEKYGASIARMLNSTITVCTVLPKDIKNTEKAKGQATVDEAKTRLMVGNDIVVNTKMIISDSIDKGIIMESQNYDAIILGATGKGLYPQILFGNIPEHVAQQSEKPVIMIKHYHPVKALLGRVVMD